jgi:flagellar protein FliS
LYNNAAQAYGTQQVKGAPPVLQVAMLYERAIGSLQEAVAAIEAGDINKRWSANKRAMDIVTALMASLDGERGGEIAQNLDQLYTYLLRRLPMVDVRNDPAPAKEAIELLKPLCESWQQLARGEQTQAADAGTGEAPESPAEPSPQASERASMNLAI